MKKQIRDGKGSSKKAPCSRSAMSGNEKKELQKAVNGCNGESTVKSLTARLKKSPVWYKSEENGNKLILLQSTNGYCGSHTPTAIIAMANS